MSVLRVWKASGALVLIGLAGCAAESPAENPGSGVNQAALEAGRLDQRAVETCDQTIKFDFPVTMVAGIDTTVDGVRDLPNQIEVISAGFDEGLPKASGTYAAICVYEFAPGHIGANRFGAMWVSDGEHGGGQGIIAFWAQDAPSPKG